MASTRGRPSDADPGTRHQRALAARGYYAGPITGVMDRRTQAAIRAYQRPQGLDSAMISLAAARQMGLIAVEIAGLPVADPAADPAPDAD